MKTKNSSASAHSKSSYFYKNIFSKPSIGKQQRNLLYTALDKDDDDEIQHYILNSPYHSRRKNNDRYLCDENFRRQKNVDNTGSWAKKVRLAGRIGPRRRRRFNHPCCFVILCFTFVTLLIILISTQHPFFNMREYSFVNEDIFSLVNLHPHKCSFPTLNPFDQEMMRLIKKIQKNNATLLTNPCSWEINQAPTSFLADDRFLNQTRKLKLNKGRLGNKAPPSCCYTPFYRVSDSEIRTSPSCIKLTSKVTRILEEFVELYCQMPIFHTDYRDAFAMIPEKPKVESRVGKVKVNLENQLSVILFGLDSVSHMHFIRQLHQSRNYLINELKAIPLNGYTKVAENTLPNVIPMLSGMSLMEFTKLCISSSAPASEISLDDCPFIWKEFSSRGYRTSYAEDQNPIGIFNMNWPNAFRRQPTDYDLRTLTRHTEAIFGSQQCQGSRTSFKLLLDNVINMAKAFKDRLYFQFTWSTRLSHDHIENIHIGDQDMLTTLKSLNENGLLNKSVLIVISDHGSRLDEIRASVQGELEDRMPLAYITVPPWLDTRYPIAMKNLRENSNSSLEDHIVNDSKNPSSAQETHQYSATTIIKYQNLFSKISENRTCFEAGIPLHWCLCNRKIPFHTNNDLVHEAMTFILDGLNKFIESRSKGECAPLELKKITGAMRWKDEKMKDLPKNQKEIEDIVILQISFLTEPGTGAFEGTVIKSPKLSQGWTLTERIVRTSRYGDESYCVQDHEMKEYCYCIGFENYM